jgi:hypothetical protein
MPKNDSFFFTSADSPDAAAILQQMVQSIHLPILGLIVKVNERDEVVNVELADENTIKSLAFASRK